MDRWCYLVVWFGVVIEGQDVVQEDIKLCRHVFEQHLMVVTLLNLTNLFLKQRTRDRKNTSDQCTASHSKSFSLSLSSQMQPAVDAFMLMQYMLCELLTYKYIYIKILQFLMSTIFTHLNTFIHMSG